MQDAILKPVGEFEVRLGETRMIGPVPLGMRRISMITGGRLTGPGLEGDILPGGSDWQLIRDDEVVEIAARFVVQLRGGGYLTVYSQGYRHGPPEVVEALARGEPVSPDLYYFSAALTIEAQPPHEALARTVIVATCARKNDRVTLSAYAVQRGE